MIAFYVKDIIIHSKNKSKKMKAHIITVYLIFLTLSIFAQNKEADKILGVWLNEEKDGKVEIYKKAGKYFGKIVYSKDSPNGYDRENPKPKLRNRKIVGLEILTNFEYNGVVWEDGKIYDPKSGNTYSCKMTLENSKTLNIRGFVGFSLLGRTTIWTRSTK